MRRQEQADAEQLGGCWCRPGRKQRSLMSWRKEEEEEEEELLPGKKRGGSDGRLKRHLVGVRKVEGKPESRLAMQRKWIRC